MNLKINRRKVLRNKINKYMDNMEFRDYRILPKSLFWEVDRVGIHKLIDSQNWIEHECIDAVAVFCRDGYSTIYLYI